MSVKIYTKLGKWYSVTYLGLVALAFVANVISGIIARKDTAGREISLIATFFLAIAAVVAVVAMIGIFQGKIWAKWITIGIYSWYIFAILRTIISVYLSPSFVISTTWFEVIYLIGLIFSVLGIVLLLQKPQRNVSS